MKVILINGSPHQMGCTYTALCEVGKTLNNSDIEIQHFWIGNKPLSGCIACGGCVKNGKCVIEDTVNQFLDLAQNADGFIFGSPVHYAAASGAMTSFMDRTFFSDLCGKRNSFYLKPAAALVSARRAGTTATLDQLNKYFLHAQMFVVPSRYWNMVYGNSPEQVMEDKEGLQIMRTMGRNMAYILGCQQKGSENGIKLPEKEERIATNFIR
ncbi:flavodoxin family protein [Eubacteriaceae bacterium ES2]|nr:flavodoxin family protein [Eubacteriaceae bacterium ES2]